MLFRSDRKTTIEEKKYELQLCEKCGVVIGTKKHLIWLSEKLGPLSYANPSLILTKSGELFSQTPQAQNDTTQTEESQASDFMRILCPKCKCFLFILLFFFFFLPFSFLPFFFSLHYFNLFLYFLSSNFS